ncbi:MAG: DUF4194 domain-containing protein [Pirellulaceae bacterium]|nr:DUF4194 domain-containing protein [Pirellulaceae bacterium]
MTPAAGVEKQSESSERLPGTMEWSAAAVRLLQGVVYHNDNEKTWDTLLRSTSPLSDYFAKIGLLLVVDEAEGMAYLRQLDEDEIAPESDSVPRLFRRTPLGYEASLLCVLLRDRLRQFEEEDVQNERCVVAQHDLLDLWKVFFSSQPDEVKLNRSLQASLRKLEELKFVRQFEDEPLSWEIRRILKARIPLSELENLKSVLTGAVESMTDVKTQGTVEGEVPRTGELSYDASATLPEAESQ